MRRTRGYQVSNSIAFRCAPPLTSPLLILPNANTGRYEITEVSPDSHILEAMEKQAAAERLRREKVLIAEGNKRQVELESEAQKIKLINESEGNLIKVSNEAEAERVKLKLEAEGEADSIRCRAQAQAESIRMMAEVLQDGKGSEAAQLALAREYAAMYGQMGQSSNTMLFQDRPADVNSLMAQAAAVLRLESSSASGSTGGTK